MADEEKAVKAEGEQQPKKAGEADGKPAQAKAAKQSTVAAQARQTAKKKAKAAEQAVIHAAPKRTAHKARNIGIDVPLPEQGCDDDNCPFHGTLPVRGSMLEGTVISDKMNKTVVVKREYMHFVPKYERIEKRTSKHRAHSPPCLGVKAGDIVTIMECRPLSKTVAFVVIQNKK